MPVIRCYEPNLFADEFLKAHNIAQYSDMLQTTEMQTILNELKSNLEKFWKYMIILEVKSWSKSKIFQSIIGGSIGSILARHPQNDFGIDSFWARSAGTALTGSALNSYWNDSISEKGFLTLSYMRDLSDEVKNIYINGERIMRGITFDELLPLLRELERDRLIKCYAIVKDKIESLNEKVGNKNKIFYSEKILSNFGGFMASMLFNSLFPNNSCSYASQLVSSIGNGTAFGIGYQALHSAFNFFKPEIRKPNAERAVPQIEDEFQPGLRRRHVN